MKINDGLLFNCFDKLFEKKIIFYGAGNYGRLAMDIVSHINGINVICFIETDADSWIERHKADEFYGLPVKDVTCINQELANDTLIIIAANYDKNEDIIQNIQKCSYVPDNIITWFGFYFAVQFNINDCRISRSFSEKTIKINECRRKVGGIESYAQEAFELLNPDSIIVYQPGKVGSTTVCQGLEICGVPSVHIHDINTYSNVKFGFHKGISEIYHYWVEHISNEKCINIISLVRDPIARSISSYFQHFHDTYIINMSNVNCDTLKGVTDYIIKEQKCGENGYMFQWFDNEFNNIFDIDVYKYPFNKEKGYSIIHKDNINILLLQMEKLNENEGLIAEFIGNSDFTLVNSNIGSKKPYSYLYHDVLNEIELSDEILNYYYVNNLRMDHFYSDESKHKMRRRWSVRKKQ